MLLKTLFEKRSKFLRLTAVDDQLKADCQDRSCQARRRDESASVTDRESLLALKTAENMAGDTDR